MNLWKRIVKRRSFSVIEQYGQDRFFVSFSGGRDSTVLSEFLDIILPGNTIPRVFADTGIELNAVREFVKEKAANDPRYIILKPSVKIKPMLEEKGYPFKSKEHSERWFSFRNGARGKWIERYISEGGNNYKCPKVLRYQFEDEFVNNPPFKMSDKCCLYMKEKPLDEYQKNTGRVAIVAIMRAEGGRRSVTPGCVLFDRNHKLRRFFPFAPVEQEFIDYLTDKYNIKLCKLYYPPYNFERTGCKGCPFNPHLQRDLDTLKKFFPVEYNQCQVLWKPVYDEYRRLGYRLRKDGECRQCEITDYLIGGEHDRE